MLFKIKKYFVKYLGILVKYWTKLAPTLAKFSKNLLDFYRIKQKIMRFY
jgi:hypothetical protein